MTRLGALVLTLVSFALRWAWEEAQCRPFFVHAEPLHGHLGMFRAVVGDVVMTWIAYGFVAVVSRDWHWIARTWGRRHWIAIAVLALAMSIGLERYALATGRWSYTPVNPLVPGIGVSVVPILQLLLLFPAALGVTAAVLRWSPAEPGDDLHPPFSREKETEI